MFPKKEEMGLFLPPYTPFNYVSLFTTSFSKCLPDVHLHCKMLKWQQKCDSDTSHSFQGWPLVWKLPGTGSVSGVVGKSRRQKGLISHRREPQWACCRDSGPWRWHARTSDTQSTQTSSKYEGPCMSQISWARVSHTLGFQRAMERGGQFLPSHFLEGRQKIKA